MPSTAPLTTALPNVDNDPASVRVVLFGMPDAGKSSLLGALVQATHTQDRVLRGRLLDLSNGMAELWRRAYEDRQRETREEIVPYPVYFEPYAGGPDGTPNFGAMVYDCDGRIANELLAQRQALDGRARKGSLAQALADADAIILTIDASAGNEQVDTDFREFVRFLRVLQAQRSRDHAVGGLPVFLALSKCDRLVHEPVPKDEWQKRIALRQAQVKERFAHYLEGATGAQATFGSIDMRVYPTAVKQPALTDQPALPRTPFGVAELFRDCLHAAFRFRERCGQANSRLRWVVGGAGGFLAIVAAVTALFIRSGGPVEKPVALAEKVARFESRDLPLPDRLNNEHLQRRATELAELRENPDFSKLPEAQQHFVRGRMDELQAYLKLREQVLHLPAPEKARSLEQLDQIRNKIETQAVIPATFRAEWEKRPPPAVLERDRRLQACQKISEGVKELEDFFKELKNRANKWLNADFQSSWEDGVNAVFDNEQNPPFRRSDAVKGVAYEFDEAKRAEQDWLGVRHKLIELRDLALALGLTRDQPGPEAVLVMGPLPPATSLNSFCAARWESLRKLYPSFSSWSLADLSDAPRGEARKKLKRCFDRLIRDGQRLLLDKLRELTPSGDDSPRDWQALAAWLMTPPLRDFRELLDFVSKLLDPTHEAPVAEAAGFLRQASFDIQLRRLTVVVPNNLPQGIMQPGGPLQVHWRPQGPNAVGATLMFRLDKKSVVEDARERKFTFILEEGDGKVLFKPGDEFSAELPLLKAGKEWEFVWSHAPTASFAFACLTREPILRTAMAKERGSIAEGVTVTIDGRFPVVPALLPDLRRERK
jgi:GTPase SAR1 family protein